MSMRDELRREIREHVGHQTDYTADRLACFAMQHHAGRTPEELARLLGYSDASLATTKLKDLRRWSRTRPMPITRELVHGAVLTTPPPISITQEMWESPWFRERMLEIAERQALGLERHVVVTLEPDDLGRDFEPRIVVELVEVED